LYVAVGRIRELLDISEEQDNMLFEHSKAGPIVGRNDFDRVVVASHDTDSHMENLAGFVMSKRAGIRYAVQEYRRLLRVPPSIPLPEDSAL